MSTSPSVNSTSPPCTTENVEEPLAAHHRGAQASLGFIVIHGNVGMIDKDRGSGPMTLQTFQGLSLHRMQRRLRQLLVTHLSHLDHGVAQALIFPPKGGLLGADGQALLISMEQPIDPLDPRFSPPLKLVIPIAHPYEIAPDVTPAKGQANSEKSAQRDPSLVDPTTLNTNMLQTKPWLLDVFNGTCEV